VFGVRDIVSRVSIWKTERGDVTFMTQALSAAPNLNNYKAHWPITDMMKM
jgi:hypothetical protein